MKYVDLTGLVLVYENTRYYVLKEYGVNLIVQKEGTSEVMLLNKKKSKFTVDTTNEPIDLPLINATLVRRVDYDAVYQLNGISGELIVNSEIIDLSPELNSGDKFQINPLFYFRFEISKLEEEGLLEVDLNNIKLTKKGLDLANQVWQEFI